MKAPTKDHIRKFNKKYVEPLFLRMYVLIIFFRELPIVPVVIDPILARKLRPHQVEGELQFLV
jgi:DNA repair and recombination protein RAD54B